MAHGQNELLRMRSVRKTFGGAVALDGASFDLRRGEVHALMGENGAGKSTLMKVLAGVHQPDSGTIEIDGREVSITSPIEAARHGIAIIHQELSTVPGLTVAENLALGSEPLTALRTLDRKAVVRQAAEKLARIGAEVDPREPMGQLSVGRQQMVEIARAIAEDARILILDEPTAALSEPESQQLFALIDEMRAEGIGLVYISHRMEEVWRLSDRITVFRDGRYVATSVRGELEPADVVNQMIGRTVDDLYVRDDHGLGSPVLEVDGLCGAGVGPVSFTVHAGEVVGLVGLVGAGRTEIARLIGGADRATGGEIRLHGEVVRYSDPAGAIRHGVGLLPEDRKAQALFPGLSITDNVAVASLDRVSRAGVLRRSEIGRMVAQQMKALRIRSTSARQRVGGLSGGNQQKVVLARWLMVGPDVLVLDEPTRGVDIGAKHEIYRIVNEQATQGVAVLIISSDLPEALGMCDRLLVVRGGRVVRDLGWASATEEEVMLYATGVATEAS